MINPFKIQFSKLLTIAFLSTSSLLIPTVAYADEAPKWPDGKKAAISLTYDDSLMSHLENAIPTLDKNGLKGTFFLITSAPVFTQNMDKWREVAKSGHELGNHTLFHPCRGVETNAGREWVQPARNLNTYTLERVVQEVTLSNELIKAVDGQDYRSFAFPCGDSTAGGKSFISSIMPLMDGARGFTQFSDDKAKPFDLRTFDASNKTGEELIALVDGLIASGGYTAIVFHGVGGDYITVSDKAHKTLVAYLKKRKDDIWVAPVRDISKHYKAQQKK